jgi:protein pelota
MKVLHRAILKDGAGQVKLLPQEDDDMWHLYHLLAVGDVLTASSFRKLTTTSATGSTSSSKVRIRLTIGVEDVAYDSHTCMLRVKGVCVEENEYVKMGQYHTIDLVLHQSFTLHKDQWDAIYLDRLDLSSDPHRTADVAALLVQPGLAHLCLVTTHLTLIKQKVEMNIPKKRGGAGAQGHDAALLKFFAQCYDAIVRHVNFAVVKCCIIASPGFIRDDLFAFILETAVKQGDRAVTDNKAKFLLTHASSAHKHALTELLSSPQLAPLLVETKSMRETKVLHDFHRLLMTDPSRAYYGYGHVARAVERRAVQSLLVTDVLFKSKDLQERRRYVQLVEDVKEQGGEVLVLSGQHVSGEELTQLTGVAAILRFGIEEAEMDDEEGEGAGRAEAEEGKAEGAGEEKDERRSKQSLEEAHEDLM